MSRPAGNTVFVLGAGFSAAAGFPLVRDLRSDVLAYLRSHRHPTYDALLTSGAQGFEKGQFYEGLDLVDPAGELGFEEILILAKSTSRSRGPEGVVERVLKTGCSRLLWGVHSKLRTVPVPYKNFSQWLQTGRNSHVVSFNWDLLVEKALTEAGIPWAYSRKYAGAAVLKPHGSINWNGHRREGLVCVDPRWHGISPESKLCFNPANPLGDPDPQLVNPNLQYMIYPGDPSLPSEDNDLRLIWDEIARVIAEAESIVFIGYSLPEYDSYASDRLAKLASGKSVEAYTPSAEHLARYKHLFGNSTVREALRFEECPYAISPP